MREQLYKIISLHSGQDVDRIRRDADRDFWMSPQDAVEYGLIDRVLLSRKEISRDMPQIPSTTADQRITIEETSVNAEAEK